MNCRYCECAISTVNDVIRLLTDFNAVHTQLRQFEHRSRYCDSAARCLDSITIMLNALVILHHRIRELDDDAAINISLPSDLEDIEVEELLDPLL